MFLFESCAASCPRVGYPNVRTPNTMLSNIMLPSDQGKQPSQSEVGIWTCPVDVSRPTLRGGSPDAIACSFYHKSHLMSRLLRLQVNFCCAKNAAEIGGKSDLAPRAAAQKSRRTSPAKIEPRPSPEALEIDKKEGAPLKRSSRIVSEPILYGAGCGPRRNM